MCWPFCPVFKHADKALSVPVQLGIRPLIKHDAVLDVFRRQFFSGAGRPVKWDKAAHFSVLARHVKDVAGTLQQWAA